MTAFGARVNEETFRLSKEYFIWITLGIPFYMFGQAINPIIRSDGSPRFAMVTLAIGAIINIILDPVCIYILHWGMTGAALATIFGQIISAILAAVYLYNMKATPLNKKSFVFKWELVKKIIALGFASFFSQISIVISMAATINMAVKYGAIDIIFGAKEYSQIPTAITGIVSKFFQIIISISAGLAAGCIPIFGYNLGAGKNDRVIGLTKLLMSSEFIVGLIASIIFLIFPAQLMRLFGSDNESIYYTNFGIWFIRAQLCLLPLACINKGTFILLQSLGKSKESSVLSVLREILFGAGLPILLPYIWGLYALPFFMPLADALSFIIGIFVLHKIFKQLITSQQVSK